MKVSNQILAEAFRDQAVFRMGKSLEKVKVCLSALDQEAFWHAPNKSSNSPARLLWHLQGNIGQYILSGLGGEEDQRDRHAEFNTIDPRDRKTVESDFFKIGAKALEVIRTVPEAALIQRKHVQGFELSGTGIILHVVEHLSYHTGQLVYLTKELLDVDLGFYRDFDLNQKNN